MANAAPAFRMTRGGEKKRMCEEASHLTWIHLPKDLAGFRGLIALWNLLGTLPCVSIWVDLFIGLDAYRPPGIQFAV